MDRKTANYGPTETLVKALDAAVHALRSYQYENASTELAEAVADHGEAVLAALSIVSPQEQFARWLEAGPGLAKAANCYVRIKVTSTLSN